MSGIKSFRVAPGSGADLAGRNPSDRLDLDDKQAGVAESADLVDRMRTLQNRLWAEERRALLVVFQGMDASGKDGTIRRVFSGVNPQGCRVTSFRAPSHLELAHDYLWRIHLAAPRRGEIGIWNRSHYEDVVTVFVQGLITKGHRRERLRHIRNFERMLHDEGTEIIKVFLHISRDEQRARLQARLDDPEKRWKFNAGDLEVREHWDEYQAAYETALSETSTKEAPWYVVPANHKWARDVAVGRILVAKLGEMDPEFPPPMSELDGVRVQ
ncbi:MAG TPA: polyphosphate kinase 2 family protein [Acidimicrobiia bacterium]|nr:polyphosphate kinase 2 family protein [Acidimicrobiia bacterium]